MRTRHKIKFHYRYEFLYQIIGPILQKRVKVSETNVKRLSGVCKALTRIWNVLKLINSDLVWCAYSGIWNDQLFPSPRPMEGTYKDVVINNEECQLVWALSKYQTITGTSVFPWVMVIETKKWKDDIRALYRYWHSFYRFQELWYVVMCNLGDEYLPFS